MTNILKIPTSFQLFGQTIEVEWDAKLADKGDMTGAARYRENKIQLQPNGENCNLPQTQLEAIFLHELIHWILHSLQENELDGNEKLVDLIATLLHQALKTAEYE